MFHHLSYYLLHINFNFKIINFFIFIPQPNFLLLFYYEEQPVPKSIRLVVKHESYNKFFVALLSA